MKEPATLSDAETEISNIVYAAVIQFFEQLEGKRLRGSGHHMAQDVAASASNLVRERWIDSQKEGDLR